MANKFQIKRSAVPGNTPNTTSSSNSSFIDVGELAINVADEILYSSDGSSLITLSQQGFTGSQGDTGFTGSQGDTGFTGSAGADGIDVYGINYTFDTSTTESNPGAGKFRFSIAWTSGSPGGTYEAYVSDTDNDSTGIGPLLSSLDDSTNANKALCVLYKKSDPTINAKFYVTGQTDNTGWRTLDITYIDRDNWAIVNNCDEMFMSISIIGDAGGTGFTGSTGSSNVVPSNTAPTPSAGTIWFDTRTGKSYFYYNDGDSSQWILFADPTVTDGEKGYTGSKGDTGDTGFTGSQGIQGFTGSGGGGGASVTTSTSAPAGPSDGDLWWNEEEAQLKIYYDDGNSAQWVDATSGAQGNTGFTGSQGTLGYTGSQGAGFTGSAGATGFTGSQGDIGYTGSRGDTGFTGSQGDQGTSGFTGSASTVAGPTGFTGSRGSTGFTGSKGDTGFTGSASTVAGPTGFTGSQGDTGFTGSQGTTGFTGSKGDTYLTTSSTSLTIGTGSKSLTVGTGLAYSASQTVKIANDASNYMEGTVTSYNSGTGALVVSVDTTSGSGTFSSWTVNLAGSTGAQGDTGFTGSRGTTGFTGSAGSDGGTGFTGSQGDIGFTGSQGDAGASGNDGATGFTGSSGITIPRGISLYDPTSSEDVTMFYTDSAITVSEVRAVCRGTSPSVTYTLKEAADRSATGTTIATATVTNTTTGATATISSSSIASGRYVWLETSATSGTVNEFHVNLSF